MEKQRLLQTLEELRAEVAGAEQVDPDTLAQLRQVTDDIRRAIDNREKISAAGVEQASHGLKDLLLKFEGDHPQMSAAVGKVADALAAMGF